MTEVLYQAPRNVLKERAHDYLYDSAYIVSGARDYTRRAFQAAMQSAQVSVQPMYNTMFSDHKNRPRNRMVVHPNCRLPQHMYRSYADYVELRREADKTGIDCLGKEMYQFNAMPRQVLVPSKVEPGLHFGESPITPVSGTLRKVTRGTQSQYRETSAQTKPWEPDAIQAPTCEKKPEVLYLNKLQWGPGEPYRTGDLPADFHTTEIINKMRHARVWMDLIDSGKIPGNVKKRDDIIKEVEMNDWIFREAEIDELQGIRLTLLHKVTSEERQSQANRNTKKLSELWNIKKKEMQRKIERIRRTRDRELRKLNLNYHSGGTAGLTARMRASRAGGPVTESAFDPTSDVYAPVARHGYQARGRHAKIQYDPSLITYEDHKIVGEPPAWLEQCGQNLKKTCSGHHLVKKGPQLCERETKWSEQFLENLHNDLKKARVGAAMQSAGPLHVLRLRRLHAVPRPATPTIDPVGDVDELNHQNALLLQRFIRGRAVQTLMYEGRTRAAELTEELKSTHGLQREDKIRIDKDEAHARDYNAKQSEAEQKEDAIAALVDELCGGAVSAALDFLEKELRRLKYERRQHAFIMIALREKTMREAAEAGRRQKEIHRRREHDEMFKQILGFTQETVDVYLREIIEEGVALAAEEDAVKRAEMEADRIDREVRQMESVSTAEQNELVAELVQQFLLPEAHKTAARHRITQLQRSRMENARKVLFGFLDEAKIEEPRCTICGSVLDDKCRCLRCRVTQEPVATSSRRDPRWLASRRQDKPKPKDKDERFPLQHELRCKLQDMVAQAVELSNKRRERTVAMHGYIKQRLRERTEALIDARAATELLFKEAVMTEAERPLPRPEYSVVLRRQVIDAFERPDLVATECRPPTELPSEIRRREMEEAAASIDPTCHCIIRSHDCILNTMNEEQKRLLLPSELRILEEMRRCKCDYSPHTESFTHDVEHQPTPAEDVNDTTELATSPASTGSYAVSPSADDADDDDDD